MTQLVHLGRRLLWVPAAASALALVLAVVALTAGTESPDTAAAPARAPEVAASRAAAAPTPVTSRRTPGAPRRVQIGALDIDAPVVPVVTDGASLDPPPDPQQLGWWSGGAPPGAKRGSALVTGHTVHDGGGALDDLEDMQPGAEIVVRTTRGPIRYVAESVVVLDKATLARRSPGLFSQEVAGRLVLVTCEDWDGTGYLSNVVVTAVPSP